jgi:hypothetical protein
MMDEQPPDRLIVLRDEVEAFRSDLRFLLDDIHQVLDAADGAPWTKPGDLSAPIAMTVAAIQQRLAQLSERTGRLTCTSCGRALGWDELSQGHTRCAVCTSHYEI